MKSIERGDFIIAGMVERPHGTSGELRLSLNKKIKLKEWVFIEMNQKPVPFFIESILGTELNPVVKLSGITTLNKAALFSGKTLLAPADKNNKKTSSKEKNILGFSIIDEHLGELGNVESIDDQPYQELIKTTFQNKELLIPFVEEFILKINLKKKILYVSLPDGMTDLSQ